MSRFIGLTGCIALFALTTQVMGMADVAQITYVDAMADPGKIPDPNPDNLQVNVTVQGSPIDHGVNFWVNQIDTATCAADPSAAECDDGLWAERNRETMNGGSVMVLRGANDAIDDGDGILWTTTPTLDAGKYYVYVFLHNAASGTSNWNVKAAIGEKSSIAELTTYDKTNATNLVTLPESGGNRYFDGYETPEGLLTTDGGSAQDLMIARIGEVVLAENGPITVSTAGAGQRVWYEGIGYVKVETCDEIPDVTISPIRTGASAVTVMGIDPNAEKVNVYKNEAGDPIGSVVFNGSPAPSTAVVNVTGMTYDARIDARQVIDGVERCRIGTQAVVGRTLHYVDATPNTDGTDGNTTIDGELVDFDSTTGNARTGTSSTTQSKWYFRTGRSNANGGNLWQVLTTQTVTTPLVTTLTLEPGTYNLYGLFYNGDQDTGRWDVAFRVGTEGGYINWNGWQNASAVDPENGTNTNLGGELFVEPIKTRDGGFWLCMAPLGQYTVTDTIDIYVTAPNRDGYGDGSDQRTWYDGVAYELVHDPLPPFTCDDDDPPTCWFTDGFGDGDRDNDGLLDNPDGSGTGIVDDPNDIGLRWYKVDRDATYKQTVWVGPDIAEPAGLGTDNALHVSAKEHVAQVAGFAPVSLKGPNEYIRLKFNWRMTQVVDFGDTFRFGLFHDGGTPVNSDQGSFSLVKDDPGYIIAIKTGGGSDVGHMAIGHPDHWWGGLGLNPSALFGQDLGFYGPLPWPEPPYDGTINDTNPHEIELTIIRREDDRVWIDVAIDGGTPSRATWTLSPAPYADRTPVLFFNQVAFGTSPTAGEYDTLNYVIDDVEISTGLFREPCEGFVGDIDADDDVDMDDFAAFQRCLTVGLASPESLPEECQCFDFNGDGSINVTDLEDYFIPCASGAGVLPDPDCLPAKDE